MRKRTVLLVAALLVGAVGGPWAGLAGADATLEVVVKTAAGGPVGGADVTASWEDGPSWDADAVTRTTAGNGRVFVDVPEGANVTLEIDHPNYVRNDPYEVTDAADEEVRVTVWEKATASVTAVDDDGPVEDARVVFRKGGDVVAVRTTNAQGSVRLVDVEAGEYVVSFAKAGYFQKAVTMTVRGEVSGEVPLDRGSVTVEFLVVDDKLDPPKPVPEATIDGPDFTAATRPDGKRAVSLPVNTELTVTVEKEGYESVRRGVLVHERDKQVNVSTRRTDAVRVAIANERVVVGESLRVTVTDEYGDPLPGATVYLDGEAVGQPDGEGDLQVPIESDGEHALTARFEQVSSERLVVTGVQPGAEGVPDGDADSGPATVAPDPEERSAGFLGVPGVGPLHLRSTAIGAAGGLLVAAVLFLYVRFG